MFLIKEAIYLLITNEVFSLSNILLEEISGNYATTTKDNKASNEKYEALFIVKRMLFNLLPFS